jgi:hypothetical protein
VTWKVLLARKALCGGKSYAKLGRLCETWKGLYGKYGFVWPGKLYAARKNLCSEEVLV